MYAVCYCSRTEPLCVCITSTPFGSQSRPCSVSVVCKRLTVCRVRILGTYVALVLAVMVRTILIRAKHRHPLPFRLQLVCFEGSAPLPAMPAHKSSGQTSHRGRAARRRAIAERRDRGEERERTRSPCRGRLPRWKRSVRGILPTRSPCRGRVRTMVRWQTARIACLRMWRVAPEAPSQGVAPEAPIQVWLG